MQLAQVNLDSMLTKTSQNAPYYHKLVSSPLILRNLPVHCNLFSFSDEVSENEKLSSSVSSDTRSSESCLSIENSDDNKNYLIAAEKEEVLKSCEHPPQSEADTQMSQIDSDLLEYMTEFKLFTDGFVTNWFKTFSFNTAEIREYLAWLENKGWFGEFLSYSFREN